MLFVLNRRRDILTIRNQTRVREVAQGTQMLAAELDDPSLLPVTHIIERTNHTDCPLISKRDLTRTIRNEIIF